VVCTSSARTVSFISASGGVGKTTLALGLASYVYRVAPSPRPLLVDLDPTAGLSLSVLSDEEYDSLIRDGKTLSDMLSRYEKGVVVKVEDYVQPKKVGAVAFDLLVPGEELGYHIEELWRSGKPVDIFKRFLEKVGVYGSYSFVIFDSAPFFDQRYTVLNLYASNRYVVVLRPSLIDFKRTIRMLKLLVRYHGETIAGSTPEFFRRFLAVFNMVSSITKKERSLISSFLSGGSEGEEERETHLKDMQRYAEELKTLIEVSSAYLPLKADYARLEFLRGKLGKENREEFDRLMGSMYNWVQGEGSQSSGA